MNTVGTLTAHIEGRFQVGRPTDSSLAVTGEPYVVIGTEVGTPSQRGTVGEGRLRELSFDEETACFAALSAFNDYAEDCNGLLYWRVRPRLEWNDQHNRCLIYMRCLISAKPVRQ